MRIQGVILPSEPLVEWESESLPYRKLRQDQSYLAWQMQQIRQLRKEPIVLLGPEGDNLLRAIPKLSDRKMVFTRDRLHHLLEQIQVGLRGSGSCSFFLPLEVPTPSPNVWLELERTFLALPFHEGPHILAPTFDGQRGFPLIITKDGRDFLENIPQTEQSLFDVAGLIVQDVPVESSTCRDWMASPQSLIEYLDLIS